MKRPYLRRHGSRPPGQPRKSRDEKIVLGTVKWSRERMYEARDRAASTVPRPADHPAPIAAGPRRDRNGELIDESLVLSRAQERHVLKGLRGDARAIADAALDLFWNWPRTDQIALRAFAQSAARLRALDAHTRRSAARREEALIFSALAE